MPTRATISDDAALTALRAFILDVLPDLAANGGVNVRQGQQNNVPMPPGPNFIIITPASRAGLATTRREYRGADGMRDTTRSTRVGVQLNFYGETSTDDAQIFNQLFRDLYGCDFLRPYGVQPLWCDDGRQMPLVDSEKQYVARWLVQAQMQINPTVSTSQQFADIVAISVVEAD